MTDSSQRGSESSVSTLKTEAERNGWKLDIWPGTRFDPKGEVWLEVGRARIVVKGREAEEMCAGMLEALGTIAMESD